MPDTFLHLFPEELPPGSNFWLWTFFVRLNFPSVLSIYINFCVKYLFKVEYCWIENSPSGIEGVVKSVEGEIN